MFILNSIPKDNTNTEEFGNPCQAIDGHDCDSQQEAKIDNQLFMLGIPHKRAVSYPFGFNADWKIPKTDIYIEYFGLTGKPDYDRKTQLKKQLVKKHGLTLVEIYPEDLKLDRITQILEKEVIKRLNNPPSHFPLAREQKPILTELNDILKKMRSIQIEYDIVVQEKIRENNKGEPIIFYRLSPLDSWISRSEKSVSIESLELENAIRKIEEKSLDRHKDKWNKKLTLVKDRASRLTWRGTKLKQKLIKTKVAIHELKVKTNLIKEWNDLDPRHPLVTKRTMIESNLRTICDQITKSNSIKIIIEKQSGDFVAYQQGKVFTHNFQPHIRTSTPEQAFRYAKSNIEREYKKKISGLREEAATHLPWLGSLEPQFSQTMGILSNLDQYILIAKKGRFLSNPLTWFRKLQYSLWKDTSF